MTVGLDKEGWVDHAGVQRRDRFLPRLLQAMAGALESESDRWFLWLPVLFASGILVYFALPAEPDPRLAIAMLLAGIGVCFAFRDVRLGIALGGAVLAIAAGFGTAKLRTDFVRGAGACQRASLCGAERLGREP